MIGRFEMIDRWLAALLLVLITGAMPSGVHAQDKPAGTDNTAEEQLPWDFDPYRVLILVAGVEQAELDGELGKAIRGFLDRDFKAVWRTDLMAATPQLAAIARRDFASVDYSILTANDTVLVMKRNHINAARIRYPADIPERLGTILAARGHADKVRNEVAKSNNEYLPRVVKLMREIDGDLLQLRTLWSDKSTEAMFIPRGMAAMLDPAPKLIELEVPGRFGEIFADYDKLFVVSVDRLAMGAEIKAREIDCLMRWPGPISQQRIFVSDQIASAIGRCVASGFAPIVRLDDIGSKEVEGRLRAGGLIVAKGSPADIKEGDFLQPLLRKDDRNGEPEFIGVIDWTYLQIVAKDQAKLKMQIQTGRAGALSGRRNSRTFRTALKLRPIFENTTLRLHAKGTPLAPLAGYDVFDKNLTTGDMTLVGQTDWDGRLEITKTEVPMRLLYVKNGQAVLARLPIVPGQTEMEVADLVGDDIRLQAEAYVRGVQNAIVDLVAIRKLIASNIRLQLQNGELDRADELLDELKQQPSYDKLANEMERRKTVIKSPNRTEQVKIDRMFGDTRTLLTKFINPALVRELENEVNAAKGMPTGTEIPAVADNSP